MKETIQWEQTYLLTYLSEWNRLQIILVLCFSAEWIYAFETHCLPPASLLSSQENQPQKRETTNFGEMQTLKHAVTENPAFLPSRMVTALGRSLKKCMITMKLEEMGPHSPVPCALSPASGWATGILKCYQFPCQCHSCLPVLMATSNTSHPFFLACCLARSSVTIFRTRRAEVEVTSLWVLPYC